MYYNLEYNVEPKIIGVRNGAYQVELDKSRYTNEEYAKFESTFIKTEFTAQKYYPEEDFCFYFKKLKSAKETSFMAFCPFIKHGLYLINSDTLRLMQSFNIQRHKTYRAIIHDTKLNIDNASYSVFYSVLQDYNVIDFRKSIFTSGGHGNNPLLNHTFTNEIEKKKYPDLTHIKTLALSKEFDKSLNLFQTRYGGIFVSERLKNALEADKVTGIEFRKRVYVILP